MKPIRALAGLCLGAAILSAGPAARISKAIDNSETFILHGHTRPRLATANDMGASASTLTLSQLELHFSMSPSQAVDLNNLLAAQRNRNSASYHKWLTPEEFGVRFGASPIDLAKVKTWLESAGFSNVEVAPSRTFVQMSGTAAHVNNLFAASIHQYQRNGRRFYANADDPVLPRALQSLVSGVKGLSNYQARPFIGHKLRPQIGVGINGNHFLGPNDLAAIYNLRTLYNQGTDGTGQTIAIVGQSDIALSDIEAFQKAAGLPVKDPLIVMAGPDPGSNPDDASEADLDLEWTGAMARGATVMYVNSPDVLISAEYAIEHNLAPIISISYGLCEADVSSVDMDAYNAEFKKASALGISVIVASGDTGAAACDVDQDTSGTPESAASLGLAVSFPASSPFVTAVGGTEFDDALGTYWDANGHATSYIPEIAWNDTPIWKVLSGSGGGASTYFAKPDWQSGTGVPSDTFRDVPDIALSASPLHDPYLICTAGSCSNGFAPPISQIYFVGGTSCAAPVFAGILALLNQSSSGRQGNVNAALYSLASFSSGVFHDVELGDNRVPCTPGSPNCGANNSMGFTAGPGYDQVTGLGSIDATQLIGQWSSDFQLALNPASLTFASGGSSSAAVQVTRFKNFNGNVTFTCAVANSLKNTTCSVPGSVSGLGVATLTVSNTSAAAIHRPLTWLRSLPPVTAWLLVIAAASLLIGVGRRKPLVYAGFATICFLVSAGCGSGNSQNTSLTLNSVPLKGNVIVTATSGTLQHTITVPVTIS